MKYLIIIFLITIILNGCCINKYTKIYTDGTTQTGIEYKFLFLTID